MKKLTALMCLLFVATVSAQETYLMWNDVETQRFGKEVIFKIDNKLLEGKYKIAENSGAYTDVSFKNGRMFGIKKDFDFSGKLEQEVTFNQNGKPNGKSISYYSDGTVFEDFNYKDGLKEGEWKTFDKKGKLRKTETYKNDLKEGKWVAQLLDAGMGVKLVETNFYKNDKPTGTWSQKTEDGRMIWEKSYKAAKDYTEKNTTSMES